MTRRTLIPRPTRFHALAYAVSLGSGCAPTAPTVDDGPAPASTGSTTDAEGSEGTTSLGLTSTTTVDDSSSSSSSSSSGTTSTDESTGEPGDSTSGAPGDTTPPEVVYFDPADGASQVHDQTITIAFSEPMDQASVESAFPTATSFDWNLEGTQVHVEDVFPFQDVAVLHDLILPRSVSDLAGNGLAEPFVITIELAALKTATLLHVGALTGNSVDGDNGNYTWFMGGDHSSNLLLHGGITFSVADLPSFDSVLAIRQARYRSQVLRIDGNFNDPGLGGLVVDHVIFDSRAHIDDPTMLEEAFAVLFAPGDAAVGELVDLDVADQLAWTWSAGMEYFQFRFHAASTEGGGDTDRLFLRRGAEENGFIVPGGFPEPDPANQSRIEIEYFQ